MEDEKEFQVHKKEFLERFASVCKKAGVVFKKDDTISKSTELYWSLFKLTMVSLVAACASAKCSLSGVLSGEFSEVGKASKDPNKPLVRYFRPKLKFSSKIIDMYKENRGLVGQATDEDSFKASFDDNFAALLGEELLSSFNKIKGETVEVEEILDV